MTPQERQLIDDLFDRLARAGERTARSRGDVAAITQGLRERAQRRLCAGADRSGAGRSAEARRPAHPGTGGGGSRSAEAGQSGGFLDSMRDAIFGQNQQHGSVPNVRAPEMAGGSRPAWNSGQVLQQGQPPGQYGQPAYGQPYGGAQQTAAGVRRRWRLVPRNRGGGRGRRGRRIAAARQHPFDDGRQRQPSGVRRHRGP